MSDTQGAGSPADPTVNADSGDAADNGQDFAVEVSDLPTGVRVVAVSGAIDLLTAPAVDEAIGKARLEAGAVRLDLRRVGFLGSAGLSVLVDAARHADSEGHRLAIVAANRTVLRAMEVTGLDAVLPLFDDVEKADQSLID